MKQLVKQHQRKQLPYLEEVLMKKNFNVKTQPQSNPEIFGVPISRVGGCTVDGQFL